MNYVIILFFSVDDDPEFPQQIYDWAMNIGTTFTLLLSECLESSNDLTPAMKRISVRDCYTNNTTTVHNMIPTFTSMNLQ